MGQKRDNSVNITSLEPGSLTTDCETRGVIRDGKPPLFPPLPSVEIVPGACQAPVILSGDGRHVSQTGRGHNSEFLGNTGGLIEVQLTGR
jgi:hypothetical protein